MLSGVASVEAWIPGTIPSPPLRMASQGLAVDSQNRVDVIAFWHAVYLASEGYGKRINWNGNLSGNNGTISGEFVDDVERRVNYFRAMSGLPGDVGVNTGSRVVIGISDRHIPDALTLKSTAAQSAALLLVRNYNPNTGANPAITHNPPNSLVGWSSASWNGAAKGNFAFGLYGPGAVTEYLVERFANNTAGSDWNTLVGHRRWVLNPGATDFATGDFPGDGAYFPPTNVLYVIQNPAQPVTTGNSQFVSYPPSGYVPAALNSPFWSLSCSGANFNSAGVAMTDSNGVAIPIINVRANNDYGDPALIWEVSPAAATRSVTADTKYNVSVTGIQGLGIPSSYTYSVTLINPNQLVNPQSEASFPGSSHTLSGPTSSTPAATSVLNFTPLAGAESLQVATFLKSSAPWKETAEVANLAKVLRGSVEAYPLIVNPASFSGFANLTGSSAFRLTFPIQFDPVTRLVPEQSFELDRDILPEAPVPAKVFNYYRRNPFSLKGRELAGPVTPSGAATLSFQYRRGYMTKASQLAVEISTDGGANWSILGDTIIGLTGNGEPGRLDNSPTTTTRALPVTGNPIRIRFRYSHIDPRGSVFIHQGAERFPTGIFIDEITTTNCSEFQAKSVTTLAPSTNQFIFNAASAGTPLLAGSEWQIRLRSQVGGTWFQYGPAKSVTISAP